MGAETLELTRDIADLRARYDAVRREVEFLKRNAEGAGLASMTDPGVIEIATLAEMLALSSTQFAATPGGIAILNGWVPVKPSTIVSVGATVTVDSEGRITIPAGTTKWRLNGILQAGYEYEVVTTIGSQGGTADSSLWMRTSKAGTENTSTSYYTGGYWWMYNSTGVWYAVGGGNSNAVGTAYSVPSPARSWMTCTITLSYISGIGLRHTFAMHTDSAARTVIGGGYGGDADPDGLVFFRTDGNMQGSQRVYRRRLAATI